MFFTSNFNQIREDCAFSMLGKKLRWLPKLISTFGCNEKTLYYHQYIWNYSNKNQIKYLSHIVIFKYFWCVFFIVLSKVFFCFLCMCEQVKFSFILAESLRTERPIYENEWTVLDSCKYLATLHNHFTILFSFACGGEDWVRGVAGALTSTNWKCRHKAQFHTCRLNYLLTFLLIRFLDWSHFFIFLQIFAVHQPFQK